MTGEALGKLVGIILLTIWCLAELLAVLFVFSEVRDKGTALILGAIGLTYAQAVGMLRFMQAEKPDGKTELRSANMWIAQGTLMIVQLICAFNIFIVWRPWGALP